MLDCILYGSGHLVIREVFEKFAVYGIHISLAKCKFMSEEVMFINKQDQIKGKLNFKL